MAGGGERESRFIRKQHPCICFAAGLVRDANERLCGRGSEEQQSVIVWHKVDTDKSDVHTSTSEYTKPPRIRKRHQRADKFLAVMTARSCHDMTAMELQAKALEKKTQQLTALLNLSATLIVVS